MNVVTNINLINSIDWQERIDEIRTRVVFEESHVAVTIKIGKSVIYGILVINVDKNYDKSWISVSDNHGVFIESSVQNFNQNVKSIAELLKNSVVSNNFLF